LHPPECVRFTGRRFCQPFSVDDTILIPAILIVLHIQRIGETGWLKLPRRILQNFFIALESLLQDVRYYDQDIEGWCIF